MEKPPGGGSMMVEAGGVEPPSGDPTRWALRAYPPFRSHDRGAWRRAPAAAIPLHIPRRPRGKRSRVSPLHDAHPRAAGTPGEDGPRSSGQSQFGVGVCCFPAFYEARGLGSLPPASTCPRRDRYAPVL